MIFWLVLKLEIIYRVIIEISANSPCLWASFHPLTPLLVTVNQGSFIKSQYEMLKLSRKCWIPAFNAQGSREIIVAVQVGAVKIYVAAVEALAKKERQGETQEPSKWFSEFHPHPPPWMLMYFFAGIFWISPCLWPNSGYWCCLFLTLQTSISNMLKDFCFFYRILLKIIFLHVEIF